MTPLHVEVPEEMDAWPARATHFGTLPMYARSSLCPDLGEQGMPRLLFPPGLDGWAHYGVDSTEASTAWAQDESPLSLVGATLLAACHTAPQAPPATSFAQLEAPAVAVSPRCGLISSPAASEAAAAEGSSCESPVSRTVSHLSQPECVDDVETEAKVALAPLIREILKGDAEWLRTTPAKGERSSVVRWWSRPGLPLLCPVSEFPICLLPYPPFKLRVNPERAHPHRLVDGKFLAMQIIVTGRFEICGRTLVESDMVAIDEYTHRCKLGPYRLSRFLQLSRGIAAAKMPQPRAQAALELERFQDAARGELGKLRRIQENRLLQIKKLYQARCSETSEAKEARNKPKSSAMRGRLSAASTASTRASSGSFDLSTP